MATTDHAVPPPSGTSLAATLAAFAWKATGMLQDIRALDGQAGRRPAGAASGSPGVAGVLTRFMARAAAAVADELRIRRDMRELRAMDDAMLNDIGLTRADIGTAVCYGSD